MLRKQALNNKTHTKEVEPELTIPGHETLSSRRFLRELKESARVLGGMPGTALLYAALHGTAARQELVLRRQVKELHRLVGAQRLLQGIDPLTGEAPARATKVEEKLLTLLDEKGGISRIDGVPDVLEIMRGTKSGESSRKLLILVLEKTTGKMPCLAKFVKMQGLAVLSMWLTDASKVGKPQLVMKILKLLPRLPVTVSGLRDSGIGKLVNKLTKQKSESGEEIRKEAAHVVDGWKALAMANVARSTAAPQSLQRAPVHPPKSTLQMPGKYDTKATQPPKETKIDLEKKVVRPRTTVICDNDMFGGGPAAKSIVPKKMTSGRDHVRARAERMKTGRLAAAVSDPFETGTSGATDKSTGRPISPNSNGRSSPTLSTGLALSNGNASKKRAQDQVAGPSDANAAHKSRANAHSEPVAKRKRVTWPADDKIARWKYFTKDDLPYAKQQEDPQAAPDVVELDMRTGFHSALQEEKAAEKRAMGSRIHEQVTEAMRAAVPWSGRLSTLSLPKDCAEVARSRGDESKEQHIQVDREKSSFEAFYTQQTIPPSPAEPPSVYDRGESAADHAGPTTIVIPLDDGQPMNSQQMAAATPVAPSASQLSSLVEQITNLQQMTNHMGHNVHSSRHSLPAATQQHGFARGEAGAFHGTRGIMYDQRPSTHGQVLAHQSVHMQRATSGWPHGQQRLAGPMGHYGNYVPRQMQQGQQGFRRGL